LKQEAKPLRGLLGYCDIFLRQDWNVLLIWVSLTSLNEFVLNLPCVRVPEAPEHPTKYLIAAPVLQTSNSVEKSLSHQIVSHLAA